MPYLICSNSSFLPGVDAIVVVELDFDLLLGVVERLIGVSLRVF